MNFYSDFARIDDAQRGSAMLRDAIFRARGVAPPRQAEVQFSCCPSCGVALAPISSIQRIQKTVAAHYDLPASAMVSQRRGRAVARPRQIAMFLARELTPKSLPDIGRRFGGRDHTTVIHAIRQVKKLMSESDQFAAQVEGLREALAA